MKKNVDNEVLVVDDDIQVLESTSLLLIKEGYSVTSCSSANEALTIIQENKIDVVLSDVRMPEVSGIVLIEKIHKINSRLPVILMTAYADLNVAVDAINKGAFDLIIKPSPPNYLLNSLSKAFQHNKYLKLKENYNHYLEDMVRQRTQDLESEIFERRRAEESLQRSEKLLRALASRLQDVEEIERKELARELHDRVGQNLTGLSINMNIIRNQLSSESIKVIGSRLDDSMALIEDAAEKIRHVMDDLRPEVLDDYGLAAALKWYGDKFQQRTGIEVSILGDELPSRLPEAEESAIFRVSQEALTNIAKHADAGKVILAFDKKDGLFRLTIEDNGKGFNPEGSKDSKNPPGWGIITMQERINALGGIFHIASEPGKGTKITINIKV